MLTHLLGHGDLIKLLDKTNGYNSKPDNRNESQRR